jgi:hypothetical protein
VALLSKNKNISKAVWQNLTKDMDWQINNLSPENYLGLSVQLSQNTAIRIRKFFQQNPQYQLIKKD